MGTVILLVGTSKGLVVYSFKNQTAVSTEVHFTGFPVSMVFVDERNGSWWVGISHRHWGEKLHYSTDRGYTWHPAEVPSYQGYDYRPGKPATLKKLWAMQHAGTSKPSGLWLGTEPGGLFYSDDYGKSFVMNENLWNHPSRLDDLQWFGTGKDFPFIHSIIADPRDNDHLYVGVSCAGVFETTDGGKTWTPRNNGLIAAYLPNATTDVGHDPHQMLLCQAHPDVIWQQNHCGIFRTTNGGKDWKNVGGKSGFPSYGFALAIDNNDPDVAWVVPAESDQKRVPVDLRLQVCRTTDGGKTWSSHSKGLVQQHTFDLVLRHGLIVDSDLLAFGTNNGNLYYSFDKGESWSTLSTNLAPVNSLAASRVEGNS